ncbi:MAG: leucyl/phenylalanyl-tRNA--protein transferase [Flavobacteriaceae bacterium]
MHILNHHITFPNPREANEDGLLAIGGDLSTERLLIAYNQGIFPWFNNDEPILWWSPDPRMVVFPNELHISKSMKVLLKQQKFTVTKNKAFRKVIEHCAEIKRQGQSGTWITDEMIQAYIKLHELGKATSIEVWLDNELVGGLYGIDLNDKKIFCGESMFSLVSNASKIAFITLVQQLKAKEYNLIDCQVYTRHLESLGAREISRDEFLTYLK